MGGHQVANHYQLSCVPSGMCMVTYTLWMGYSWQGQESSFQQCHGHEFFRKSTRGTKVPPNACSGRRVLSTGQVRTEQSRTYVGIYGGNPRTHRPSVPWSSLKFHHIARNYLLPPPPSSNSTPQLRVVAQMGRGRDLKHTKHILFRLSSNLFFSSPKEIHNFIRIRSTTY